MCSLDIMVGFETKMFQLLYVVIIALMFVLGSLFWIAWFKQGTVMNFISFG